MSYLFVFLVMALLDFCWARYIIYINGKRPVLAGSWSAAITLGSAMVVVSYGQNHLLIIPAVVGAFVGTWLSVKWKIEDDLSTHT